MGFRFGTSADACDAAAVSVRYVDDTLAASRSLCCACLRRLVVARHPVVPFNEEGSSATGPLRWLDLVVHVRGGLHIAAAMPERQWVLGAAALPQAFRVPPFLCVPGKVVDELRSHVRSRLSRWAQIQLSDREVARALVYDLLVLVRSGYPPRLAARAWLRNAEGHRSEHIVRATCRILEEPATTGAS